MKNHLSRMVEGRTMKKKQTETKFKSLLGLARHSFGIALCLGAVILTCSTAWAQNLFVSGSDTSGGKIFEFKPNGVQSTFASGLRQPLGLAFDSAGNLFVAVGGSILEFAPNGVRSTFAFGLCGPTGLAFDSAGNLFVADNCSGPLGSIIYKFKPNGVRSTFVKGSDRKESFSFLAFQPTSSTPDTMSAP